MPGDVDRARCGGGGKLLELVRWRFAPQTEDLLYELSTYDPVEDAENPEYLALAEQVDAESVAPIDGNRHAWKLFLDVLDCRRRVGMEGFPAEFDWPAVATVLSWHGVEMTPTLHRKLKVANAELMRINAETRSARRS